MRGAARGQVGVDGLLQAVQGRAVGGEVAGALRLAQVGQGVVEFEDRGGQLVRCRRRRGGQGARWGRRRRLPAGRWWCGGIAAGCGGNGAGAGAEDLGGSPSSVDIVNTGS